MELEKMMLGAMEFNFSPILAKEIGLNGAIVLSAIELYRKENSKKNNVIDYKCIQGKYLPFYSICTISRIVKRLVDTGYLDKIKMTPEQIKNMVIQNKNFPLFSCEWCGCGCNILHEVKEKPFWKREKYWKEKFEGYVLNLIVNPIEKMMAELEESHD